MTLHKRKISHLSNTHNRNDQLINEGSALITSFSHIFNG